MPPVGASRVASEARLDVAWWRVSDERREHTRHAVWFPVSIESPAGEGVAITHDASSGGLLVSCPGSLEVGAVVTVTFRIRKDEPEHRVKGKVVRIIPTGDEGPWRFRIALGFDEPMPELEALLARAAP